MGNARFKVDFDEQVWKRNVETTLPNGRSETFPLDTDRLVSDARAVSSNSPNTDVSTTNYTHSVAARDAAIGLSLPPSNDLRSRVPTTPGSSPQ